LQLLCCGKKFVLILYVPGIPALSMSDFDFGDFDFGGIWPKESYKDPTSLMNE